MENVLDGQLKRHTYHPVYAEYDEYAEASGIPHGSVITIVYEQFNMK